MLWAPNEPLKIEEIEVAPPAAGEVRIKVLYCGVCHTDLIEIPDPENEPAILGHEGCGIVESIGEGVTTVAVGQVVIPLYIPTCGTCEYCTHRSQTNLCQRIRGTQGQGVMPDGTSRFSCKGKVLHHFMGVSCFAQYTVVPEIAVCVVPQPEAPMEKICLFGCGITTGLGAVWKTAKVEAGATVAVFGLGGVGLSAIQGARIAGASRIIAVDINETKFEMARAMGATDCVNPKAHTKPIQEVIVEMTSGGVDYSFEAIGNVHTMRAALECCHKGWGVSTIIGVAPSGTEISTRPFQLVTGRRWQGTAFGGVKGRVELPGIIQRYLDGEIALDPFITHTMPLAEVNEAFELMKRGESIRAVLTMWP